MKNQTTETMQDFGLDKDSIKEILETMNSLNSKVNDDVDLRGVGKFIKYPPIQFEQLAESEDGRLAVTYEVRDWEMSKGKNIKSGTSKKIHIRSKFINSKGELVYGYDLASFSADKELMETIVLLLTKSLKDHFG